MAKVDRRHGEGLVNRTGLEFDQGNASPHTGAVARTLAAIAGYLTAKTAPRAPRVHAGALAGVLLFFSIAALSGFASTGEVVDPAWYPTAMLFVPCEKGISHNPAENAKPEDLAAGAKVLAAAVMDIAGTA